MSEEPEEELVQNWRGRLVLLIERKPPRVVLEMSKVGDPYDWDEGPDDDT